MTTTFIIWPVADDPAFRDAYAALTGEVIQDAPALNAGGDRYMAGSSRVSADACQTLQSAFPDLVFGQTLEDLGWQKTPETDIFQSLEG